jgi:peroxiredoxin Q/BCP
MTPNVGSPAPAFLLPDQEGTLHSLENELGQWVVLYFYPKDDTSGCTKEACGFRDAIDAYDERDVAVFGVSRDSVESHEQFASKYELPFCILSDENGEVTGAYGVWREKIRDGKTSMGIARTTFLINPEGNIVKIYEGVDPEAHADQVLADIDALSA